MFTIDTPFLLIMIHPDGINILSRPTLETYVSLKLYQQKSLFAMCKQFLATSQFAH